MKIVVYTVNLGFWDALRPPRYTRFDGDIEPEFLAFTDQPGPACAPWQIQPAYLPMAQTSRNARLPKMLPHLHFDADVSIYHDANFQLKKSPEYLIDRYLQPPFDIAMFRHPCRTNIGQEAELLIREKIGNAAEVSRQLERWKELEQPDGLWAGGFIIRRHTPEVAALNETWWLEFAAGSTRDQLAFPLAKHQHRATIRMNTIDGNILGANDLMAHNWHTAWKDKGDNRHHELVRAPYVERRRRLIEVVR